MSYSEFKNNKNQKSVEQALFFGVKALSHLDNAQLEAEVLLCSVLGADRTELFLRPEKIISDEECNIFVDFIEQRALGMPVAYITGIQHWYGYDIVVTPDVLIPRDETEVLVEHIKNHKRDCIPQSILDVGCGSGCIAKAMSYIFLSADVLGLDISKEALLVAEKNTPEQNITLKASNMLEVLDISSVYDVIVANLPYVPNDVKITTEVSQEPSLAIFSDDNGMNHIQRLKDELEAKKIVWKELWIEFLPESKKDIASIFKDYVCDFKQDVSGQDFFALIRPSSL